MDSMDSGLVKLHGSGERGRPVEEIVEGKRLEKPCPVFSPSLNSLRYETPSEASLPAWKTKVIPDEISPRRPRYLKRLPSPRTNE